MNPKKRTVWFLAVVGIQILFLAGLIFSRAIILLNGETILLEVIPVDPDSYFRGKYVVLSYEFSRMTLPNHDYQRGSVIYLILKKEGDFYRRQGILKEIPETRENGIIYLKGKIGSVWNRSKRTLELEQKDNVKVLEGQWTEKDLRAWDSRGDFFIPVSHEGKLFWKCASSKPAQAEACGQTRVIRGIVKREDYAEFQVNYGLEDYFTSEKLAPWIESEAQKRKIVAEVAVSSGGRGVLRQIWIDGKAY